MITVYKIEISKHTVINNIFILFYLWITLIPLNKTPSTSQNNTEPNQNTVQSYRTKRCV